MNLYLILLFAPVILFLAFLLRIFQWVAVDTVRAAIKVREK